MKMWTYTLRELFRRPGRTLLTLAGIVIGVAAMTAVVLTTQATRQAAREMFESLTGRADLEVVAEGMGGFDPAVAERLEAVKGVKKAVPEVRGAAGLLGKGGLAPLLVFGIDPSRDAEVRDYQVSAGEMLGGTPGLLLPRNVADAQGLTVGQVVRLTTASATLGLPLVGTLAPQGAAAFNGGAVAFVPLAEAQKLFGLAGKVNAVQLVLAEDADLDAAEREVAARLPELGAGLTVQRPAQRGELVRASLFSTEQALATVSLVSLVAGAFVILNTFLMSLGERRRQIAILRALGATRKQVTGLLLREAALLGVAGTLLGVGGGLLLAQVLRRVMAEVVTLQLAELRPSWEAFALALVLGPGVSLAATWLPARAAARRPPLQGLGAKRAGAAPGMPPWTLWLGLGLVALTLAGETLLVARLVPPAWAGVVVAPMLALGMLGCVLSLPAVLGRLSAAAGWLLRPLLGVEGKLAIRQLERQPVRTALTVGVLFVGSAVSIGFGNSLLNNVRSIHEWYDRTVVCDFLVRDNLPDATFSLVVPLPEDLGDRIRAVKGIAEADRVSFVTARAHGRGDATQQVLILAREFSDDTARRLSVVEGDPQDAVRRLRAGDVVLGTVAAQHLGLGPGDELVLETGGGPRSFRVAATQTDYTAGGMSVTMDWPVARRVFSLPGVHAFEVTAEPGQTAAAEQALRQFCKDNGLMMQTNAEMLVRIQEKVGGVEGFLYALMALLFVVASLGVVNTLTMNVLEQTRDFGVLRAMGLRRAQARKMVLSQALLLAVVSLAPGVLIGLALAWLMNLATEPLLGQHVPFRVDGVYLGLCLLAALAVALAAGLPPARRAARLAVIEALHYE